MVSPPPCTAFEDDAIAVPVSAAAAAASRYWYVLISVTLSGDKHLIRV